MRLEMPLDEGKSFWQTGWSASYIVYRYICWLPQPPSTHKHFIVWTAVVQGFNLKKSYATVRGRGESFLFLFIQVDIIHFYIWCLLRWLTKTKNRILLVLLSNICIDFHFLPADSISWRDKAGDILWTHRYCDSEGSLFLAVNLLKMRRHLFCSQQAANYINIHQAIRVCAKHLWVWPYTLVWE